MTTITVATNTQLASALKSAKSGDTILLKAGTYSSVSISNMNYGSGITIASADPTNKAVITKLTVSGDSGITFSNLNLNAVTTSSSFQVSNSKNITFDHVTVTGAAGSTGYTQSPFFIRSSTNVTVTNSEFTHTRVGLTLLNNTNVTVSGNYFHDIRSDGIDSGGNSQIKVANNFFTDFHPASGDHPDAIQFWTTNTTTSAHDITVTGNVFYAGSGDPIQGVFISDQVGTLPYQNVTVTNNVVIGGLWNGILLSHVNGATVSGNVVGSLSTSANTTSWLTVINSTGVSADNNAATTLQMTNSTFTSYQNNKVIPISGDGGQSLVSQYSTLLGSDLPKSYITTSQFASLVADQAALHGTASGTNTTYATTPTLATSTGAAHETIFGTWSKDTFAFHASDLTGTSMSTPDVIVGFSHSQGDHLDLSAVDAISGTSTNEAFSYIGTAAFTHHAGELHYQVVNGSSYVSGDLNGDGVADFTIELLNVKSLVAADLVL